MAWRSLSWTEISTVLDCQARHAFRYTGRLTDGDALRPRLTAPKLQDGRAWGRAVACWHAREGSPEEALWASLKEDADEQAEKFGMVDMSDVAERRDRLVKMLAHYCRTAERLPNLTRIEGESDVPVPSRSGGVSNKYRFKFFADGFTTDDEGRERLVEFKLRDTLSSFEQVELSRQIRWGAWSFGRAQGGRFPVGVIVDERWNEVPKPVPIVKAARKGEGRDGKRPSHKLDQLTTPEIYIATCNEYDVEPEYTTVLALQARRWQARHPVPFRPSELDESALELTGAAQLIGELDNGRRHPLRNPKPWLCRGCQFRRICVHPEERSVVDLLFERTTPKRDKPQEVTA